MFNFNIGPCDSTGIFISVISILALLFVSLYKGYSWAARVLVFFIKTARILVELSGTTWSSSGKSWFSFLSLCQCHIRRWFRAANSQLLSLFWWACCRLALSCRQETWSSGQWSRVGVSVDSIIIYSHQRLSIWIAHIIMFTWSRISGGTWSGIRRRRFPSL